MLNPWRLTLGISLLGSIQEMIRPEIAPIISNPMPAINGLAVRLCLTELLIDSNPNSNMSSAMIGRNISIMNENTNSKMICILYHRISLSGNRCLISKSKVSVR